MKASAPAGLALLLAGCGETPAPPVSARVAAVQPTPVQPLPAPAPAGNATGLRLHGLLASGAIIAFPDGRQRLVPVGREALPGVVLRRIEQNHAVLASAGSEARLGFDGAAGAPSAAPSPPRAAESGGREETLRYRLGLAPRRVGGRVMGFTVRRGAELPALARAGIRPGDTILAVNGSIFDDERMLELSWQIANSTRTEFEIERGGRRLRVALGGGPDVTDR